MEAILCQRPSVVLSLRKGAKTDDVALAMLQVLSMLFSEYHTLDVIFHIISFKGMSL